MDTGIRSGRTAHKNITYTRSVSEDLERACPDLFLQNAGRSTTSNGSSKKRSCKLMAEIEGGDELSLVARK
jgi:hypothetical protein